MGINYPGSPPGSATDTFTTPSNPSGTPLAEAGSGNRDLVESIGDEGLAITALQGWAALRTHDHSGDGTSVATGAKLSQSNTHQNPDTNASTTALHHTLGNGQYQAMPGNYNYDYNATTGPHILNRPYIVCTSSTRPSAPFLGMMIFETDTNFVRIWSNVDGSGAKWNLVPLLVVPTCRLQAGSAQNLASGGSSLNWQTVLDDNNSFFNPASSLTDIVIHDGGLYDITASMQIATDTAPDNMHMVVTVNTVPIPIRSDVFLHGEQFSPGFSQTLTAAGKWRLSTNDVVRLTASFSASGTIIGTIYTYYKAIVGIADYSQQTSRIDVVYHSP